MNFLHLLSFFTFPKHYRRSMSTKKRDKPDISESTSEFEHVSKRDKTNEEANEDSFDCELLRSNIDLTIFQIQQLKNISTKLLNSHKEGNVCIHNFILNSM